MLTDLFIKHKYRFLTAGGITGSAVVFGLCGLYIFIGNTNNTERVLDNIWKEESSILEPQLPDIEVKEEELQADEPVEIDTSIQEPQPFSAPTSNSSDSGKKNGYEVRLIKKDYSSSSGAYEQINFEYDSKAPEGVENGNWGDGSIGATWNGIIDADDKTGTWGRNEERMIEQLKNIDKKDISKYFYTYNFKDAYDTIKAKKDKGESLDGNTLREECIHHYHRKDTKTSDPLSEDVRRWCIDYSQNYDSAYKS